MTALLLALALSAQPLVRPPDAGSRSFYLKVPGVIRSVQVGDGPLVVDGLPMRLTAVASSWKWNELESFFLKEFVKAGFFIPKEPPRIPGLTAPAVVALDAVRGIHHTVILTPENDGTTTVILGESSVREWRRPNLAGDFAPLFPGARSVVRSELEVARAISFDAPASPSQVLAFYQDVLGRQGYAEIETGLFKRGPEQLRLVGEPADGGAGSRVSLVFRRVAETEESPVIPSP